MFTVTLFTLLSTSLWYLGSRAVITRGLWSRYPRWLASFADCPACVGFWWGNFLAATVGCGYHLDYLGIPLDSIVGGIIVGLCSVVLTTIGAGVMQWGFDHAGSAVSEDL